ncbi:MAG: hypothetical protein IPK99_00625 [Flavobacteriales bacterium]|nr:hypothetical protein [Flavobacteriales bacterium]
MNRPFIVNAAFSLLLCACGGATEEGAPKETERLVISEENTTPAEALYQMPTPNELFALIREMAGDGQKRLLNPTTNADRYVSLTGRAFNFGVYSTDLIYASSFKLNVEVVRYYLTVKKIGGALGLNNAFTEDDFVRLEANLSRGDSLESISNDAYHKAYAKLEDEDMGPTLALVLAGGWVESMHLVMHQIRNFSAGSLVTRVAEQKFSLEHLIALMDTFEEDKAVAPVRDRLVEIRDIYDQVNVRRSAHQGPSSSGRMVLGDDVTVSLTQEKYTELQRAVETLREELVRPEGQAEVRTNA